MSVYIYSKMTVTGNAEILKDFVKYFENDYDGYGAFYATNEVDYVTKELLNDNCYCVEGHENHFSFDVHRLSREFPGLKFEDIIECSDGDDASTFSIYINGKQVDYAEGNSSAFGPHAGDEVKCSLCNASLESGDYWEEEVCIECDDLSVAKINRLFESGQMTEDEYIESMGTRYFLFE